MRATPVKGDVWDYARAKGLEAVFRVEKNGKVVYVNSDGVEVKKPQGVFFVASSHNQAASLAEEVAKRLDGR